MTKLSKRLQELNDLLKIFIPKGIKPTQLSALPSIKQPELSILKPVAPKSTKIPGIKPKTNKNPKKVAEQLKNPEQRKLTIEMLKFDLRGQWTLHKAMPDFRQPKKIDFSRPHIDLNNPNVVHADYHGFGGSMNEVAPEQQRLIHGIDTSSGKKLKSDITVTEGKKWISNPITGDEMLVKPASKMGEGGPETATMSPSQKKEHAKSVQDVYGMLAPDGLNSARREVLMHNIAHRVGLGQYFPVTAGFTKHGEDYSAMKKIKGIEPTADNLAKPEVKNAFLSTLKQHHDTGALHMLAMLDGLMGNNDRHNRNVMFDPDTKKIHMIDNGNCIDYGARASKARYRGSGFLETAEKNGISGPVHNEALKWLNHLNNDKVHKTLGEFVDLDNSKFGDEFKRRLFNLKSLLSNSESKKIPLSHIIKHAAMHDIDRDGIIYPEDSGSIIQKIKDLMPQS